MYITKEADNNAEKDFNWETYFKNIRNPNAGNISNTEVMLNETRTHLKEDQAMFGFVFHKFMRSLLTKATLGKHTKTLELGAATGFLSRWLSEQYNGTTTLVDRSEQAYQAFLEYNKGNDRTFQYLREDIFNLSMSEKFDIVSSFGVIEHFTNKTDIINAHKKHVSKDGYVLIIIPLDTPLTRAFYEVNYELNQGYRELLTEMEFKNELKSTGLNIVNIVKSEGYVYDIIGAICSIE